MSDKIQMTEEQANEIFKIMCPYAYDTGTVLKTVTDRLKSAGYIRKSDLEILIEEAEEALTYFANTERIDTIKRGFRAMKAELNKRRDI